MNIIDTLKAKIGQIENLLGEIKSELDTLSKEEKAIPKKQRKVAEVIPSEEELRLEYDKLYQQFMVSNARVVDDFIRKKSKVYLRAFCRANNLPVDTTKVSKAKISDVVLQWMAQRKLITQKIT